MGTIWKLLLAQADHTRQACPRETVIILYVRLCTQDGEDVFGCEGTVQIRCCLLQTPVMSAAIAF